MHEFDAGGEFDLAVALIAAHPGGREHQHRAQPLAARRNQMIGHLGNGGHIRTGALKNKLIGPFEVGPDELQKTVEASCGFLFSVFERNDDTHGAPCSLKTTCDVSRANLRLCAVGGKSAHIAIADMLAP